MVRRALPALMLVLAGCTTPPPAAPAPPTAPPSAAAPATWVPRTNSPGAAFGEMRTNSPKRFASADACSLLTVAEVSAALQDEAVQAKKTDWNCGWSVGTAAQPDKFVLLSGTNATLWTLPELGSIDGRAAIRRPQGATCQLMVALRQPPDEPDRTDLSVLSITLSGNGPADGPATGCDAAERLVRLALSRLPA